jgi:DNA invertase Pin-like site-specific DNA recombinase
VATKRIRGGSGNGVVTALPYIRVSGDEQAREGLSLPAQLQACRRYAADKGWVLGNEYQDILSGKRDDRVDYQRLLADARRLSGEGQDVAVIVMRLDRLGRRVMERVRSREELKGLGVQTHSVREGGEVSDLVANILASVAQEEVERLGDRVRDVRVHNELNGWHVPGRRPFGYRWRPATDAERQQGAPKSVLAVDDETAPLVREAFRRVAAGESARSVTVWLATCPELGRTVHHSATVQMLQAAVYTGRFPSGERGRWEPLVTDETWTRVQRRLGQRSRSPSNGGYLLAGLARCPKCAGRLTGMTMRRKWPRYRCGSFSAGGEEVQRGCTFTCSAQTVDADVLAQVSGLLAPLADGDPSLRAALSRAWARLREPNDAAAKERQRAMARARQAVDDAKRRIGDATRLLVDQAIDRLAYDAMVSQEQERLRLAEAALAAPEVASPTVSLPPLQDVVADLDGWATVLQGGTTPELRRLLAVLVERVVPVRISYGRYEATVTWTPLGQALQGAVAAT